MEIRCQGGEQLLLAKGIQARQQQDVAVAEWRSRGRSLSCARARRGRSTNRGAAQIAECWKEFGIDAFADVRTARHDPTCPPWVSSMPTLGWTIETWGGHPDLFYFLGSWHSRYLPPLGERSVARNWMRWKNDELDPIIDGIQKLDFDDPKCIEVGQEFVKLCCREQADHPDHVLQCLLGLRRDLLDRDSPMRSTRTQTLSPTGATPSTCTSRLNRRRHNLAAAKVALIIGLMPMSWIIEVKKQ